MKQIKKTIGTMLFLVGFFALFGEAESAGAQLLWSLGAAALCLIGGHLVNVTLAKEDEV